MASGSISREPEYGFFCFQIVGRQALNRRAHSAVSDCGWQFLPVMVVKAASLDALSHSLLSERKT